MTTEYPPPPSALPAPPPPTAPPRTPIGPAFAAFLGALLGAAAVGTVWAVTSAGSDTPDTFTLKGTFSLTDAISDGDGGCRGTGGYDDIAEGTSVTVYDGAGKVAATGVLGQSKYNGIGACRYKVAVDDVPKGEKFYQVEVSHRGKVQLTQKEAEAGEFGASLG